MQYLANIMIYDVFSLVFFTKQYVYLVWCFSVSSLLFFFSMVKTLRILYEVKLALEEVRRDDWNINHFGVKACLESSKSNFSQRFRLRKSWAEGNFSYPFSGGSHLMQMLAGDFEGF